MSRWEDAFKNSNLEKNIKNLQHHLNLAIIRKVPSTYASEVKRVKLFADITSTICKKIDPNIMPTNHITSLSQVIVRINSHIVNYIDTENYSYLNNAADQVDMGIDSLQRISLVLSDRPVVTSVVLKSLLKKTTDSITQFTKRREEFSNTVNGLKRQVATQEKKLNHIDRDALKKIKSLEKQILDFDTKFEKQLINSKKEFQTDQVKRKSTFNSQVSSVRKTQDNLFIKMNRDIANQKTKIFNELELLKKASENKHEELISILGLASGDAMRGQHKIAAGEEEDLVTFWRRISFGSLFISVIYIGGMSIGKGMSSETSLTMAPLLLLLFFSSV